MTTNDTLSNALSHILNSERSGKSKCIIKNASKLMVQVFEIMKKHKYIKDYSLSKSNQGDTIDLSLIGNLNNCNAIKPRFPVSSVGYEKFEKRYLPAKDFGIIIVSTTKGIMTHAEAKGKKLGGRLIAYCY